MVYGMTATLDEGPPPDIFEIQLWSGFGACKDSVYPGTIPISGDETSLFDCGLAPHGPIGTSDAQERKAQAERDELTIRSHSHLG